MQKPHHTIAAQSLRWRDLLELIASLRRLPDPLASADGLRQAIALLVRLAEIVGIDDAWTDRLRQIVTEPALFNLVLALVEYVAHVVGDKQSASPVRVLSNGEPFDLQSVDAQSLIEWLPIVLEILRLLKQLELLRGWARPPKDLLY